MSRRVVQRPVPPGWRSLDPSPAESFGAAGELRTALESATHGAEVLVVRLKRTQGMDVTAIDVLESLAASMRRRQQHLLLVGISEESMQVLRRACVIDTLGAQALFPTRGRWFAAMNSALRTSRSPLSAESGPPAA